MVLININFKYIVQSRNYAFESKIGKTSKSVLSNITFTFNAFSDVVDDFV